MSKLAALKAKQQQAAAAKKPMVKKPPVEEVEDEEVIEEVAEQDDEVTEEMVDEESGDDADADEEEAPPPKKTAPAKKVVGKPAAKVAAPVKKVAAKKVVADEDDGEEETTPSKGQRTLFGGKTRQPAQKRDFEEGSWLPQDEFMSRLFEHIKTNHPEFGVSTKAQLVNFIKVYEEFTVETLQNHSLRLFGTKARRIQTADRLYAPTEALDRVSTPYHTMVPSHVRVSLNLAFDVQKIRGTVDDKGEFVEGKFDSKGNFTKGTWVYNEETKETDFKPKAAVAKKK